MCAFIETLLIREEKFSKEMQNFVALLITKLGSRGKKGKGHPITGHEGPEVEYSYSSILSLTSALYGVVGQRHAPAALPPGNTRYPLYSRLGGPQDQWRTQEFLSWGLGGVQQIQFRTERTGIWGR